MGQNNFAEITDRIRAWDGEDCRSLQEVLRDALQMKREILEEDGDHYSAEDLMEAVYLALADVATRSDAPWPSPWDKDGGHHFAEVCDRRGQYIHTDWSDCDLRNIYSYNYVCKWVPGENCEFG